MIQLDAVLEILTDPNANPELVRKLEYAVDQIDGPRETDQQMFRDIVAGLIREYNRKSFSTAATIIEPR